MVLATRCATVPPVARFAAVGPALLPTLAIGLLGIGAAAFASHLAVHFDEGYNLNLVETLAETGRYATRFDDAVRRFDPAITSGPVALLPLAPAFKLFGPTLEATRSFQTASFVAYTTLIFFSARALAGTFAALALLLLVSTMPVVPEVALSALGEYPAISLIFAATALLALAERAPPGSRRLRSLGLSGALLGLAVLAKDIALLYVLAFGVATLVAAARARRPAYLAPSVVALAFPAAWRTYQFAALSIGDPAALAGWRRDLADRSAALFSDIAWNPLSHTAAAWQTALQLFWPYLLGLALALGLAILARACQIPAGRPEEWNSAAIRALGLGSVLWVGWYLFLSGPQAGDRHAVVGVALSQFFAVVVAARLLAVVGARRGSFAPPRAIACCLGLWLAVCLAHGVAWNLRFRESSAGKLAAQLAVAGWAREHVPPSQPLSGWSWHVPWEIAFLAQRPVSTADRGSASLRGLSDWFVVSPTLAATRPRDRRLDELLSRQGEPAVSHGGYELYRIRWRPGRG